MTAHSLPRFQLFRIPELIKRVLMIKDRPFRERLQAKFKELGLPEVEPPEVFTQLNRHEENRWTGWFQGDGDRIGQFLKSSGGEEADNLTAFSEAMLNWGQDFQRQFDQQHGRVVYAGGDDFLEVMFREKAAPALSGHEVLAYFSQFSQQVWATHGRKDQQGNLLTVSVGLVWASPGVPQRDVLQHCQEAEKAAKRGGRDRLCLRVLFNGGNYVQWRCPWWLLAANDGPGLLGQYCDRNGTTGPAANWTHLFTDVATLEARHGFEGGQTDIALGLFEIYFGPALRSTLETHQWDRGNRTGILGNKAISAQNTQRRLNQWVINLAKVGFHLHRTAPAAQTPSIAA